MITVVKNEVEKKEELVLDSSMDTLIRKSEEIRSLSHDFICPKANSNNFRLNEDSGITFYDSAGELRNLDISSFALSQLGTKIGVPARYLEKCIQSGRLELAQNNVNSWLDGYDKNLFIREYDSGIRGILSDRYSICDTHEILEVLDNTVDLGKYKVKGSFLNEERFHARFIEKEMLNVSGEDLFAGLFVDSSDVGRNVLTVKFGVYKQVCTNGLTVTKFDGVLFSQKHIGISSEEFYNGLVASLYKVEQIKELVTGSIKYARKKKVFSDDELLADFIRTRTGLSEEGTNKVIKVMEDKYERTLWGVVNSLTEVAQIYTLERRLMLENIAGDLLTNGDHIKVA